MIYINGSINSGFNKQFQVTVEITSLSVASSMIIVLNNPYYAHTPETPINLIRSPVLTEDNKS